MKLAIVLGTRPEIIKMSPIIRICEQKNLDYFILHTGQHYSYEMDKKFFEDLEIRQPDYNLNVGSQPYRKQIGSMIREISVVLEKEKPDLVLVQGDTNSVLAAALAANKLKIKIGHHEAGLRSHDLTMLEETNRIITDHISDFLFVPTQDALKNITEEGINKNKVFLTGNTVVDAIQHNLSLAEKKVNILEKLNLTNKNYIITTAHRAENVDNQERLQGIVQGLKLIRNDLKLPVIFPIHPRTKINLEKFGIPCVTVRDNTERPETIAAKVNILAGTKPDTILAAAKEMLETKHEWVNPFGDGKAAEKIVEILINNFAK